jgi:phage/plasmid-like protein (TIGR03299 family)
MSDFIEQYEGQASFASLREPGWHQLGTVFLKPVTVQELLTLAHLDNWNVRVVEIQAEDYNFGSRSWYFVVRDNPYVNGQQDVLHVSGQRYTPFQNEALFAMADGLGRWETAGSIKEGRVVFGSVSLDREIVLDPNGVSDRITNYIVLAQSHDGTLSVTGANTPIRVVCNNTLNVALAGAVQSFKFRHTPTAESKSIVIADALAKAHGYIDKLEAFSNGLLTKHVTDQKFYEIITTAYPKPDEPVDGKKSRGMTMWDKKIGNLLELRSAPTNAAFADNAWGTLNVLLEDLDWFRTGRGDNAAENLAAARAGFDPVVNSTRNKFKSIVLEAVGA